MKSTTPWIKKYEPRKPKDVIGQEGAIKTLGEFVKIHRKQKKAVLIHGPTGCGKTSSVYALASEMDLELIEVNASDFRNKDQIESVLGNAVKQMSLFSSGKIIFVDEVDGVAGREDRGGLSAITDLIAETKFPMILSANNIWDQKFSTLRKKCMLVEFADLGYKEISLILERIAKEEKVAYDDHALKSLARRAGGDARAAINDLQTLYQMHGKIGMDEVDTLSQREKVETINNALVKVFKSKDLKVTNHAFDNLDEDLDKIFFWVDENLPKEYTRADDLAAAYDFVSQADVFRGRIRRWQHWRFLVYINSFLSSGVAVSKQEKYKDQVSYGPTQRILKLWIAKQKNLKKKAISGKIGEKCHTGTKDALQEIYPFVRSMMRSKRKDKEFLTSFADYFDLDKEEADHMLK
ncbi:replication factor C large subunit [Candidatus Woesearchaeota archaeon]|nr:replication factor C large subunit [Candidatus Woesearchaeota archaeon]